MSSLDRGISDTILFIPLIEMPTDYYRKVQINVYRAPEGPYVQF